MKSVCLAILNYNGVHHLRHLLPSARDAVARFKFPCPIVVLDNRSPGDDVQWIAEHFPAVEVVLAPKNEFLYSYNWLLASRSEEVVVLLNNDLRLEENFLTPLLSHFHYDDVFAVSATSRDWEDTRFTCGPCRPRSHHGVYSWDYERGRQELAHTLFACGGFMAVDRAKFLSLEGFNPLFYPAYGEDVDLSFRAWRKGWRVIFEPASLVWHRESASWNDQPSGRTAHLGRRSDWLFQWATLPRSASKYEVAALQTVTAARRLAAGNTAWTRTLLTTWAEWRRVRDRHVSMKASPHELEEIIRRIEEPVPSPLLS